jgi:hypothetical protein
MQKMSQSRKRAFPLLEAMMFGVETIENPSQSRKRTFPLLEALELCVSSLRPRNRNPASGHSLI